MRKKGIRSIVEIRGEGGSGAKHNYACLWREINEGGPNQRQDCSGQLLGRPKRTSVGRLISEPLFKRDNRTHHVDVLLYVNDIRVIS